MVDRLLRDVRWIFVWIVLLLEVRRMLDIYIYIYSLDFSIEASTHPNWTSIDIFDWLELVELRLLCVVLSKDVRRMFVGLSIYIR